MFFLWTHLNKKVALVLRGCTIYSELVLSYYLEASPPAVRAGMKAFVALSIRFSFA